VPPASSPELTQALRLADHADAITTQYFHSQTLQVSTKPDNTPVTQADLEVEQTLSAIVAEEYGDAYIGEEGARRTNGAKTWMVDPIDGTKNFLRGMPVWATLIAVLDEHGPLASVVSAPALGRRWWAASGKGSWTKDTDGTIRRLHVSKVDRLEDAFVLHASLFSWETTPVSTATIMNVLRAAWRHRGVGDFLNYMLVAEGAADVSLESGPKAWDLAAPQLILEEAGGRLWTNAPAGAPPETPRIAIGTNGPLEAPILALVQPKTPQA